MRTDEHTEVVVMWIACLIIASVLFFVAAAIGISSGMNSFLLLGLLEILVGIILLVIYIHK